MLTDEEIVSLAEKEAADFIWYEGCDHECGVLKEEALAFARAIEAEVIERCAQVCDEMVLYTGFDCAAAIRALKKN